MALEDVTGSAGSADTGDVGGSAAGSAPDNSNTASAIDLSDDHLVRYGNQKEPVKFGELFKQRQSNFTRNEQRLARERENWQRERDAWNQTKQSEEMQLKQLASELLSRQNQGRQGNKDDLLSKLESMQWIDGKTAANMFREIQEKGFGNVAQAIGQRDKLIEALYSKVVNLSKNYETLNSVHTQRGFESKISKFVSDTGLPAKATNFAKALYLAYEGDDLDEEFPEILTNAWNEQLSLIREMDKERVDQARRSPFKLPGKGGNGVAGKPVSLKGDESAKETTDFLWEFIQNGQDKS